MVGQLARKHLSNAITLTLLGLIVTAATPKAWAAGTPSISSISPGKTTAGSPGFTLKVYGSNFGPRSYVYWEGVGQPTKHINSRELDITVSSGQVASAGSYRVRVRDNATGVLSNTTYFNVTSPTTSALQLTTTSVPSGTINVAYSKTLTASGGVAPYTWSRVSGSLPPGLGLSSSGTISGTPTATASYQFSVQVKDSGSTQQAATSTFTITIANAAPKVTTSSVPDATVNTTYSAALAGSGGTTPYSWSVTSGSLPSGVGLGSTGAISGKPTVTGSFPFTAQLRDGNGSTASANLTLTVDNTSTANALWSADVETGDLSQWYYPSTGPTGSYGGGEYNSGIGDSTASQNYAHGGNSSAKMTITTGTGSSSGTRLFRWLEPRTYPKLHYTAWFYFPTRYTVTGSYWNIFQWKSKNSAGNIDPFFVLNVGNRSDGTMYLYLYNWQKRVGYTQSVKNLPANQWVKIEAEYTCAGDNTGSVTFWQDGVKLWDIANAQTRYSDGDCQWSLDNYSDGVSPNPATTYVDDATITQP